MKFSLSKKLKRYGMLVVLLINICNTRAQLVSLQDSISIQHSITETDHNGFITKIKFTNIGNDAFSGSVKYSIKDKHNRVVFTETKPVQVLPEKGYET